MFEKVKENTRKIFRCLHISWILGFSLACIQFVADYFNTFPGKIGLGLAGEIILTFTDITAFFMLTGWANEKYEKNQMSQIGKVILFVVSLGISALFLKFVIPAAFI